MGEIQYLMMTFERAPCIKRF